MFDGLHDIDWPSMHHAYGSAEGVPALLHALAAPDAESRDRAFETFYGSVCHQNSVYPPTVASLPFLFELARDAATPDRAAVVGLIVDIGRDATDSLGSIHYDPPDTCIEAAAVLRRHAEDLVGFATDPEPCVRRAAIPALGLFVDDDGGSRAATLLRERLAAESGLFERLPAVDAMATLALRLPAVADEARTWLAVVAADAAADPETRLAALAHRARSAPELIGNEVVPEAVALLVEIANSASEVRTWRHPAKPVPTGGVSAPTAAAFDQLDRANRVYAFTTGMLRTLHKALGERVALRTELLTAQLRSPDPGARLDAVRMSRRLISDWRGDHTPLLLRVADQLGANDLELAAEAAAVLDACHTIAEPTREALAAHVEAQRVEYGSDVWAAADTELRRAHQTAVCALAQLGDIRALPSLLVALDSGVDAWRAMEVAGHLREAAGDLVPRLCGHLRDADLAQSWFEGSANRLLTALSQLGEAGAVPAITDALAAAEKGEYWGTVAAALQALAPFGAAAADALPLVRALAAGPLDDGDIDATRARIAALHTLHALGGERDEVLAPIDELLGTAGNSWAVMELTDLLGRIGAPIPPRVEATLRDMLSDKYEWQRVHAAAALWDVYGTPETQTVLDTLMEAWKQNPATANHSVACLDRMGAAAEPAVPALRAALSLPGRGGRFQDIGHDEELQHVARRVVGKFA